MAAMSDSGGCNVLVLVADVALQARCAAAADSLVGRAWFAVELVPAGATIDLVVADRPLDWSQLATERPGWRDFGLVAFGGSDNRADAALPTDVSERELTSTFRLVAEIVRLRRAARAAAGEQRELARLAETDPLTGLPNRRSWEATLAELAGAAASPQAARGCCLALFDLDHFKRINDTLGQAAGDEVLRAAAKSLAARLRQRDVLARLGGDEFAALLVDVEPAAAAPAVERVRQGLLADLAAAGLTPITASAGYLCIASGAAHDPDGWLTAASLALIAAKQAGRARSVAGGSFAYAPSRVE